MVLNAIKNAIVLVKLVIKKPIQIQVVIQFVYLVIVIGFYTKINAKKIALKVIKDSKIKNASQNVLLIQLIILIQTLLMEIHIMNAEIVKMKNQTKNVYIWVHVIQGKEEHA